MAPPKNKILPGLKTKKVRNPSLSKMTTDATSNSNDKDILDDILSDGSCDSNDTIIRSELRKQHKEPFGTENRPASDDEDDASFRSSFDGNTSRLTREEGELGDDERSNPSSQTSAVLSDNIQGEVSPPVTLPEVNNQQFDNTSIVSVASSSSAAHHQKLTNDLVFDPSIEVAGVSREARMEIEKNLLKRIKEADRLKKIVDKELKKRKRVLNQKVISGKSQSTPNNGPGPGPSQISLQPSASASPVTVMAKIPKLFLNSYSSKVLQ